MKKRIHLTESQFHNLIMEVVRKRDRAKMLARRNMDMLAKRQMEKVADRITEDIMRKLKDASFPRFGHNQAAVSHLSKRPLKLL